MSRNKVAPLKSVTVPRLELQAALMSAKMESALREGLEVDIVRSYFWTDSEIVLKYIRNGKKDSMFMQLTGSIALESLPKLNWNYVPGDANPADTVSRGISVNQEVYQYNQYNQRWFQDPDYLKTYKSE